MEGIKIKPALKFNLFAEFKDQLGGGKPNVQVAHLVCHCGENVGFIPSAAVFQDELLSDEQPAPASGVSNPATVGGARKQQHRILPVSAASALRLVHLRQQQNSLENITSVSNLDC